MELPSSSSASANGPSLYMTFATLDDVYTFYNNYAKLVGFSVRKHSNNYNKNGEVVGNG